MKAIVVCGHPYSGYDHVFAALQAAGIQEAQPSRREGMDAATLHEKILRAHDIQPDGIPAVQSLTPGRMWQELAIDLFLGNMDNSQWGWAQARSTWLLDFWQDLDPQVRFVLVYASPEYALSQMMHSGKYEPTQLIERLQDYLAYNERLLHFYTRHPQQCQLVEQQTMQHASGAWIKKLQQDWGLVLQASTQETSAAKDSQTGQAVAQLIAQQLLQQYPQMHALYAELQSTASLPAPVAAEPQVSHMQQLADYMALQQQAQNASSQQLQELQLLQDEQAAIQEEKQKLLQQLQQVQEKLLAQQHKAQDLEQALSKAKQELSKSKQEQAEQLKKQAQSTQAVSFNDSELQEENELLLQQLHQVQEELEHYFLQHREIKQELQALTERYNAEKAQVPLEHDYWLRHHPAEMQIDLRESVRGSNWYAPEPDGSWAGPQLSSTIELPALRQGKYDMLVEIVDAMEAHIIEGLSMSLAGHALDLKKEIHDKSALLRARVDSTAFAPAHKWVLQLDCPEVISPSSRGVPDGRHLSVRVKTVKFKSVN